MFHVKPREKTMTPNETSFSEEIEKRAEQRLFGQEIYKTSHRKARRERIQAGKADAFDCTSEEDVVCPYCGAWFNAAIELEAVMASWLRDPSPKAWHEVPCQDCENPFLLRVEVKYSFTTIVRDES